MDVFTRILWFIVSMIKDKKRTLNAMKMSKKMIENMLGQVQYRQWYF